MSTGAIVPFTPNQPTQNLTVSGTSQTLTFNPCDALLIYNSGAAVAFVAISNFADAASLAVTATNGLPIPAGAQMLLGVPGVVGVSTSQPLVVAAIGTSGTLYVTPGLGTAR
jgi:hypothetical protein